MEENIGPFSNLAQMLLFNYGFVFGYEFR